MSKSTPAVIPKLELAESPASRIKGLIGRDEFEGAILLNPAYFSIHTFGVKFPLDVAFLDSNLEVIKIKQVKPNRAAFCFKARAVLEAPLGSFQKWGISPGTQISTHKSSTHK